MVLLAIFGFGWALIHSVGLANTSLAIKARKYYYLDFLPRHGQTVEKLSFTIIAMLDADPAKGSGYGYLMRGYYDRYDANTNIVYVKTKDTMVYGFQFAPGPRGQPIYQEKVNGKFEQKNFLDHPLTTADVLSIQWEDKRTLSQVLSEARSSPYVINPYLKDTGFRRINHVSQ